MQLGAPYLANDQKATTDLKTAMVAQEKAVRRSNSKPRWRLLAPTGAGWVAPPATHIQLSHTPAVRRQRLALCTLSA